MDYKDLNRVVNPHSDPRCFPRRRCCGAASAWRARPEQLFSHTLDRSGDGPGVANSHRRVIRAWVLGEGQREGAERIVSDMTPAVSRTFTKA